MCFSLHFYVSTWAVSVKCNGGLLPDIMLLLVIIEKPVSMDNEQAGAGRDGRSRSAMPNP